ncbi:protein SCO1/2 [Rhodobium orientis]|uniref:SCO family protein n=1 Tax=Rhodobium orientis TaxID=34017 RepID=A0A327JKJ4_9HYPH|nr:SCO family protein [Rhodobium orientis]MBB4303907.1 protein SCO1/2 [Rhodobium orientis]MBK5951452.1 SCO family protein [Rhodobium orientis]RAI26156.1 SCO family protein [Rhodobium orientis]
MKSLGVLRIALWILVAGAAIGAVAVGIGWYRVEFAQKSDDLGTPVTEIGGPFTLTDTNGNKVSNTDFAGKPRAMFFGFTYCPDVCPTTMSEIDGWMDALGPDADKIAFIYVTVDPERDTPEKLKEFISAFDTRIIGLTGTPEELDPVLDEFRVYRKKIPLDDGDYTMDHTASVYLMDGKGRFVGAITYQAEKDKALAKLRKLIERSES